MKYFAIITLIFNIACSPKGGSDDHITYQLDTVMVDSKGEIIMGATSLFLSDFDNEMSTIYNYSNTTSEIEVIDLKDLSITNRIKLEQEGPDGIGAVFRFYYLGDSLFVFENYFGLSFLENHSNKIQRIKYRDFEFFKEIQEASDRFTNNFSFLDSRTKFIGPVYSYGNDFKYFALVDLESDQMEKIKIKELKIINDFNITLKSGKSMKSIIQPIDMLKVNDLIYISNTSNNDILTFNIQTADIQKIAVESKMLSSGKSGTYKNETEDSDEFENIVRNMYLEIEYKQLVRNPENGNFYRFSMQKVREKTDDLPAKFDIHLVAYDKNFKLLSETFIPEMNSIPQVYFWKDNSIWLHENVEDELGFVRLSIYSK